MIDISAANAKKIKYAIKLANDEIYCKKLVNFFKIEKSLIEELNLKFEQAIRENKISTLWRLYLKHYKFFKKNNNGLPIDRDLQKLIFSTAMTVEVNDIFLRAYTHIGSKEDSYEAWFSRLLFEFVPPNEQIHKLLKSCDPTPSYFLELIFLTKIPKNYKKLELSEEQHFVVKTIRESKLFDEQFYLGKYPDIGSSNIDPVIHYSLQGYREGRSPSIYFDSDAYMHLHPDVKSANVNPLYHFIVSGVKEKRQIHSLVGSYKKSISQVVRFSVPESLNEDILEFKRLKTSYDLIVISHDDFSIRTGGIQKVILEETKDFNGEILFLSPTQDAEIFLAMGENRQKGYLRADALRRILSCQKIIIHSFINFNFSTLNKCSIFQRAAKIYMWAHDYSMCCSNFLLLRNNFESCGAPSIDSTGCSICVYSKTRKNTQDFYNDFFKKYGKKIKIITPSSYSKEVIKNGLGNNCPEVYVRNHIELVPALSRVKKFEKIKVAYVGSDQPHKGVGLFLELMQRFPKYEYYLFSSKNFIGSNIRYINHRTDSDNDLNNLLEAHDIDVVVITSEWEETFCITAYEALVAGCKVFCLKGSGNLSEIGKTNKNLVAFDSLNDLASELESMADSKELKKNYSNYVNKMNLNYAK